MSYDEAMVTVFRLEEELEEQGKDLDRMYNPTLCSESEGRYLKALGGFPMPPNLIGAYVVVANMERLMK